MVFDGTNFSKGLFDFTKHLNEKEPVLAIGVFTPQVDYANLWSYASAASPGGAAMYIPLVEEDEKDIVKENISRFEELCRKNDISYRVHNDFFDFVLPELKRESRFTDVVLISGELFYKGIASGHQYEYLRDALHATESPVVIVPEKFESPEMNILAYDGSEESVYAIKQFAYIFPELASNKTLLVYADDTPGKDFPSKDYIIELATQHYKDLQFYKLEVNPKRYFNTWLSEKRGCILVSGSFSRTSLSELFKKSFVTDVILDHRLPVFIAHK